MRAGAAHDRKPNERQVPGMPFEIVAPICLPYGAFRPGLNRVPPGSKLRRAAAGAPRGEV